MKQLESLCIQRELESSEIVDQPMDVDFNVLLYADESQPAFFAVVYSTILLMNMPNMHLTVVQLKQSKDGSMGTESDGINSWPLSPTSDLMENVMGGSNTTDKTKYYEILMKTNEIFSKRDLDVSHQLIYCNPNIPDVADALLEYATKNSIELIVMGTKGLATLEGLIFGSLAHTLQNRSEIPVTVVKKLPKGFLERYRSKHKRKIVPPCGNSSLLIKTRQIMGKGLTNGSAHIGRSDLWYSG